MRLIEMQNQGSADFPPSPLASARSRRNEAKADKPASSGDIRVASVSEHGTGKSREPADRNVCATLGHQFTTFCGLPARNARTFSTAMRMSRARAARVAQALCGVMTQ